MSRHTFTRSLNRTRAERYEALNYQLDVANYRLERVRKELEEIRNLVITKAIGGDPHGN